MLSELESHANPDVGQQPQDALSVMASHAYLTAVNKLFEKGFLNNKREAAGKIHDLQAPILQNIEEGFQFFKRWWTRLEETCM